MRDDLKLPWETDLDKEMLTIERPLKHASANLNAEGVSGGANDLSDYIEELEDSDYVASCGDAVYDSDLDPQDDEGAEMELENTILERKGELALG